MFTGLSLYKMTVRKRDINPEQQDRGRKNRVCMTHTTFQESSVIVSSVTGFIRQLICHIQSTWYRIWSKTLRLVETISSAILVTQLLKNVTDKRTDGQVMFQSETGNIKIRNADEMRDRY